MGTPVRLAEDRPAPAVGDLVLDPGHLVLSGAVALILTLTALATVPMARAWLRALSDAPAPLDRARWSFLEVVAVLLVTVLAMGLLVGGPETRLPVQLLLHSTAWGVSILACVAAIRYAGGEPRTDLGLEAASTMRAVWAGLGGILLLEPALFGVNGLWNLALRLLGLEVEAQPVLQSFLGLPGEELAVAVVFAVVVIPVCEEVVFRGFLQGWLVRELGLGCGILVTSLAFGALHGVLYALPIAALSLVLGWLRWRTDSLVACFVAHGVHNGLTLLLVLA